MAKLIDITGKAITGEWGNDAVDDKGIPVLRTTNFTDEGVINFDNTVIRDIPPKDLSKKYLQKGDIIIEKSGGSDTKPVGRVVYFDADENRYLINNFTGILRVKDQSIWLPRYVFYALFANYAMGGTRIYENKTTGLHNLQLDKYLNGYSIKDVDLPTQRRIVATLDKVSDGIAVCRQMLADLDAMVKARFVEMFGDPISNEMQWPTRSLEELCNTIVDCPHSTPSYTTENTGFMCIRTSIVKKNRIMWEEIEYIPEEEYYQRIQRKRPERGDVVYTREGAILGIAAIIDRDCNVALGQRSMLLSPDTEKCTSEFLSTAMNCDTFLDNALKGQSGSASPHINVGDIKAFKMIMPPIEQQIEFSSIVTQIDKSKVVVQQALDEAQTLFDSLMQKYFG